MFKNHSDKVETKERKKIPLPFWNARWPSTMTDCFGLCRLFEREHSSGKMGNDLPKPNENYVVVPTGDNSKWSQTNHVILFFLFTVQYIFIILLFYCVQLQPTKILYVTNTADHGRSLINNSINIIYNVHNIIIFYNERHNIMSTIYNSIVFFI